MKSTIEQLQNRGYVDAGFENRYLNTTFEQRIALLKRKLSTDRTIAARLLTNNGNSSSINHLIDALIIEKKLYSKIEICNSLVSFGIEAVKPLIGIIGTIGNNQHNEVPKTVFKKHNYPLPRDIASRTLIRIGKIALPDLLKVLHSKNVINLSEAIDTIGFICFYDPQSNIFEKLMNCYNYNIDNDLIKWKLFRAMSAFPESESLLKEQLQVCNDELKLEIERSLSLIKKRNS